MTSYYQVTATYAALRVDVVCVTAEGFGDVAPSGPGCRPGGCANTRSARTTIPTLARRSPAKRANDRRDEP